MFPDYPERGNIQRLDHPPEGSRKGIAELFLSTLNEGKRWLGSSNIFVKYPMQEKKPTGSIVCLRFHMLVAACCNAILRVAHHGPSVPLHDAIGFPSWPESLLE